MEYSLERDSHSVFSLSYPLVFVVKYRRNFFDNEKIIHKLKQFCLLSAKKHEVIIREQENDMDHIHILVFSNPKTNPVQFIQHIKGSSAFFLFQKFPEIKLYL